MKTQSQQSLHDQLRELIGHANTSGLYDAADFVRGIVERQEASMKEREAQMLANMRHRNTCCGNVGTRSENGREFCLSCGWLQP